MRCTCGSGLPAQPECHEDGRHAFYACPACRDERWEHIDDPEPEDTEEPR
jgi:hypothetical protein